MKLVHILLVTLLFSNLLLNAQTRIVGSIEDKAAIPLAYANVQVLQAADSSLITFAVSDDHGNFELSTDFVGDVALKVSYLGYQTARRRLSLTNDQQAVHLGFVLQPSANELAEVVINAEALKMQAVDDTIIYNLKKFTNGTEENLGDVLGRLPGLEVDDKGKIKANGRKIDKLLIDGVEFFDDQHRLATENISAEMLENVELLNKYQEFSSVQDVEESDKVALNVNIKDSFKGKVTGDVALEGGLNNRFLAHANLFQFGRKLKMSVISDYNNTGAQALTFEDYMSLHGGVQKFMKNSGGEQVQIFDERDLPSFLLSGDNVREKRTAFAAANMVWQPSAQFKVNGYSILSQTNQNQSRITTRDFFSNSTPFRTQMTTNNTGQFFLNTTVINADFKPNDKSIFNYTLNFNPLRDQINSNIIDERGTVTSVFDDEKDNRTFNLGQQISHIRRLKKRTLLTINAFHQLSREDQRFALQSNAPFLNLVFQNENYGLVQEQIFDKDDLGVQAKLAIKKGAHGFKFHLGSTYSQHRFQTEMTDVPRPEFSNDLELDRFDHQVGLDYRFNNGRLMRYQLGLDYHLIESQLNATPRDFLSAFFPKVGVTAQFKSTHVLSFQYAHSNSFPALRRGLSQFLVQDFRTVNTNDNVDVNSVIPFNNFQLRWYIFDLFSGTVASLNASYSRKSNVVSSNTNTDVALNEINNRIVPLEEAWSVLFLLDYKLQRLPLAIHFNSYVSDQNSINFIEQVENQSSALLFTGELKLLSKFNSSGLNFETGMKLARNTVNYSLIELDNRLQTLRPFVNFNGKYKSGFSWYLDMGYAYFQSGQLERRIFILSPRIKYRQPKSPWEFSIVTNNLLNLNSPQQVETNFNTNFFEETVFDVLAGYANLNVKYKF
ncbi:MAG: carboxypeptidase-like regulatory domain-containing protein [Bacteroidota bacterium]